MNLGAKNGSTFVFSKSIIVASNKINCNFVNLSKSLLVKVFPYFSIKKGLPLEVPVVFVSCSL